jgi:hypothetical protein
MEISHQDPRTIHALALTLHREDPEAFTTILKPYVGDAEALLRLVLAAVGELAAVGRWVSELTDDRRPDEALHRARIAGLIEEEAEGELNTIGRLRELLP